MRSNDSIPYKFNINIIELTKIMSILIWFIGLYYSFALFWIFFLGTILLFFSSFYIFRMKNTQKWIQVPCIVLKTNVKKYHVIRLEPMVHDITYIPEIEYEYTIENEMIKQNTIYFFEQSSWTGDQQKVFRLLQKFKKNKYCHAYINPKNNQESVLLTELPLHTKIFFYWLFVSGFLPILIGVVSNVF